MAATTLGDISRWVVGLRSSNGVPPLQHHHSTAVAPMVNECVAEHRVAFRWFYCCLCQACAASGRRAGWSDAMALAGPISS